MSAVQDLTTAATNALERWFDRWANAVNSAQSGYYSFDQFAKDATETMVDTANVSLLPMSLLGVIGLTSKPILPVVRFIMLNTNNVTRSVAVDFTGVNTMASENLTDYPGGASSIPSANVTVANVSGKLNVTLTNLGALNLLTPPVAYMGRVIAQPGNKPIARIIVVFP